ncbi:SseB family protein [Roseovarius amoyensis]|uniref:SseB family protein n=1 Tax=Roseovarius amoyensis TaxID=2211448 RepID=UPI000DBE6F0B|nr:SseB family protein [Roseovarius amoyensis]
MAETTRLDAAHEAMEAAPGDEAARRAFYAELAATELFLLLEEEATADSVSPRTLPVEGAEYVLAFDLEERLARFAGGPAPLAALSGRALAGMLAGQGLGLALNLDVAPSAILLPTDAVAWMAEMLAPEPDQQEARIRAFHAPDGVAESLLSALDARLAGAAGLAECVWLARAEHEDGGAGHLLAVIGAVPEAAPALARAVSDLWRLSRPEADAFDVVFLDADDPAVARLARVGLRFDLPRPEPLAQVPGAAPGMDPDAPPRLR